MKALKWSLMAIATSFIIGSCGKQKAVEEHTTEAGHEIHPTESAGIRLNNGEKWLVNEEMKPFIQEAEAALNEFIENNSVDYLELAATLQEKNSELIKSCTMEGESHNELHHWLHPHMELTKALGNAHHPKEAAGLAAKLKLSFETYHQYFQ